MKTKIYAVLIAVFMIGLNSYSQQIEINEEKVLIDNKPVNAWVAVINEDIDLVRKSFIKFTKDKYDLNAKKKSRKSVVVEQANIPTISAKAGDLWLVFQPENNTIKIGVAFFLGYDIIINSEDYPTEMDNLKTFVREFIVYYKSEYFNTLIAESNKRLQALSKELKQNNKTIKELSRQIAKSENTMYKEKDEKVKFELGNKNIEYKSKIQASHEIIINLKEEISKVTTSLNEIKANLKKLEVEALEDETHED